MRGQILEPAKMESAAFLLTSRAGMLESPMEVVVAATFTGLQALVRGDAMLAKQVRTL